MMSRMPELSFGVEFTLTMGCQHNCWYCPQEKLMNRYYAENPDRQKHMTFEQFKTCLSKVRKGTGITIGGMSEPFQNPECAKIVRYAYEMGYRVTLLTTLQGMSNEDFLLLENVPFEAFVVHIPDEEGRATFRLDDEYFDILKKNLATGKIDYFSCQGTVHHLVKELIPKDKNVANEMLDRAGNLEYDDLRKASNFGKIDCWCGTELGTIGWFPMVLADGTVLHCQMDYGMEHILGNLLTDSWGEIISSKAYLEAEKARDYDDMRLLCRKCVVCKNRKDFNAHYHFIPGSRAIKIARALQQMEAKRVDEYPCCEMNANGKRAAKLLLNASEVCVYGLGKMFWDNFFARSWDKVIAPTCYSDKNPKYLGKTIGGCLCVDLAQMPQKEDILVITCVYDDSEIQKELHELGIKNVLSIFDLNNMFD